ncbi:cytochrome c biogenesis CcdA family protein [Natronospora cellulosivora (SeqCode)]
MNNEISIFLAFTAGILSFFSPCIIPLLPSYLTVLMGDYATTKEKRRLLSSAFLFTAGFSIIFILLGLSASYLGQILLRNLQTFQKISGLIIIVMGAHLAGFIKIKFLYKHKGLEVKNSKSTYIRSFLMGLALAFAWTPCIGPILSSILIYAANQNTVLNGGLLLAFYSLGFALPFLITAYFMDYLLPRLKRINHRLLIIQKIAGILLMILGILIFTNYFQVLVFYYSNFTFGFIA